MKNNLKLLSFIVLTVVITMSISSCCSGNKKADNKQKTIEKAKVQKQVREFVYPLPTSFEITKMLNNIEAPYIVGLSNTPEAASKYFTELDRALNLGVYIADLSYASTYNQQQATVDYVDAAGKIIENLDLTQAVDNNFPETVENNQNNKDKLIEIITNEYLDIYNYLNKNNRAEVSVLVMTGAWVEGLYIATHISEETLNSKDMIEIVMKQKISLEKLLPILEKYKDNANIQKTIDDLKPIYSVYNKMEDGAITQKQMKDIAKSIKVIRNKFIKGE